MSLLCGSLEIEFVTQLNFSQIDQAEIHSSFCKQHTAEIDTKCVAKTLPPVGAELPIIGLLVRHSTY